MPFSPIPGDKDSTRLLTYQNTVYKLKVLFGNNIECDKEVLNQESESVSAELEQVVRAVLYLDQRGQSLQPIHTAHCLVKPYKKYWKTSEKIGFRKHEKSLKTADHFFEIHVNIRLQGNVSSYDTSAQVEKSDNSPTKGVPAKCSDRTKQCSSDKKLSKKTSDKTVSTRKANSDGKAEESNTSCCEVRRGEGHALSVNHELRCMRKSYTTENQIEGKNTSGKYQSNCSGRKTCRTQLDVRESDARVTERVENTESLPQNESPAGLGKSLLDSSKTFDSGKVTDTASGRKLRDRTKKQQDLEVSRRSSDRLNAKHSSSNDSQKVLSSAQNIKSPNKELTSGIEEEQEKNNEKCLRKKKNVRKSDQGSVNDIMGISYKVRKFRSKLLTSRQPCNNLNSSQKKHKLYNTSSRAPLLTLPEVVKPTQSWSPQQRNRLCMRRSARISNRKGNQKNTRSSSRTCSSQRGKSGPKIPDENTSVDTDRSQSGEEDLLENDREVPPRNDADKIPSFKSLQVRPLVTIENLDPKPDSVIQSSVMEAFSDPSSPQFSGHSTVIRDVTSPVSTKPDGTSRRVTRQSNSGSSQQNVPPRLKMVLRSSSASPSKGKQSTESRRLLKMRLSRSQDQGIQVKDADRHFVQQEELCEMMKLQDMAKPSSQNDIRRSPRKRRASSSGLWNLMDSMLITPVKKMLTVKPWQ